MQHYFASVKDGYVHLSESDAHHVLHVMRMKVGDALVVIDNGKEYLADIKSLSPLTIEVSEELDTNNELQPGQMLKREVSSVDAYFTRNILSSFFTFEFIFFFPFTIAITLSRIYNLMSTSLQ